MRPTRPTSRSDGFKSGLEAKIAKQIEEVTGKPVAQKKSDAKPGHATYELRTIEYTKPSKVHKYKPDFVLPNGIIVEGKGIFEADDREKMLLIKDQYPDLDIRLVFS